MIQEIELNKEDKKIHQLIQNKAGGCEKTNIYQLVQTTYGVKGIFQTIERMKSDRTHYREIAPFEIVFKIIATIIRNRLQEKAKKVLREYQCSFNRGRSVVDEAFVLNEL